MESQPVTLITAIDKLDDVKELLQKAQWIDMKLIESTGREFTSQDFFDYQNTPVTSVRYYTGSDAVAVSTFLEKCKTA